MSENELEAKEAAPLRSKNKRWWLVCALPGLLLGLYMLFSPMWDPHVSSRWDTHGFGIFERQPWSVQLVWMNCWMWVFPILIGAGSSILRAQRSEGVRLWLTSLAVFFVTPAPFVREGVFCYIVIIPCALLTSGIAFGTVRMLRPYSRWLTRAALGLFLALVFPFEREEGVIVSEITLPVPVELAFASLGELELPLDSQTPLWMKVLLPIPQRIDAKCAHVGCERRVTFENGTLVAHVISARAPAYFALEIHTENEGREFFDHWLTFGKSEFQLTALGANQTRIVHRTHYTPLPRILVYLKPIETFVGQRIQDYLLRVYAESMERNQREREQLSLPVAGL
jgi:hypothetical protein